MFSKNPSRSSGMDFFWCILALGSIFTKSKSFYEIYILFNFFFYFFSCSNDKITDQNNSKFPATKSIPTEESSSIQLEVYIDDFKMRSGPGVKHKEVARLKEKTIITYEGQESLHTTEIKLRGAKLNATWLQVKTKEGVDGWIYGGGVKVVSTENKVAVAKINQIQMNSFFDKEIVDQINEYNKQWQLSNSSTAFADVYLLAEKTQREINKILGNNIEINDPSNLIDMSWLKNSFPGFQSSLVAEGTMLNIFKDYRIMYAKAKETEGTEDDDFINFQLHVNELDSVEYYYKSWFMQTWDYGGHSLLGQGKHFSLLNEANELLAKSKLFEKSILEIKKEILNDISAGYITYWESKEKILEEMKKIVSSNFDFLTTEDKILIKTRFEQFKKPTANKIEINNRTY